jgi:hypothetical protein
MAMHTAFACREWNLSRNTIKPMALQLFTHLDCLVTLAFQHSYLVKYFR